MFETVDTSKFQNLYRPIIRFPRHCNIDKVALHSLPEDCPKDYVSIYTTGNGNWYSVSNLKVHSWECGSFGQHVIFYRGLL